ncbi:hypothetical protein [Clostridium sp.]|uniref:hypothetical protein n=1 Tax=Clostridium sp. TaxID=1506 RepID=UPI00283C1E9F|nr:hypothetical protein [Clostridium sp.]MDR3598779.1 hypothetical protein [Clostridium sp.]
MKTTKKTASKSAAKTTKKASVKNNIESKIISQPTQSEIVKTQSKETKTDRVFKYVTTFPRVTLADTKEIAKLLKSENKDVRERIEERKIKIYEIVKLSKYGHKQLLNGELKSNSMKYYITLKDDKKLCLNFANYESKKK